MSTASIDRRQLLRATALGLVLPTAATVAMAAGDMRRRPIPRSGDELPVIGLGTYEVFDVAGSAAEIDDRVAILRALVDAGGSVIDTSPMYDRSEDVIGSVLAESGLRDRCFLATKVWTDGEEAGRSQMRRSAGRMQVETIDLMQVHNRRDLDTHWPAIREMQEAGFIRYNGVTDYRESAHDEMAALMRRLRPDFIQINYSLGERGADDLVLPLARELGIAVLVNRPFVAGRLFRAVGDRQLPGWARDYAGSWAQFFLKWIVSHPAVTCAIPATSKPRHMVDNAAAGSGPMPDDATRRRMAALIDDL